MKAAESYSSLQPPNLAESYTKFSMDFHCMCEYLCNICGAGGEEAKDGFLACTAQDFSLLPSQGRTIGREKESNIF